MSAQLEWDDSTSLVDRLLAEQRTLSAVDEFSAEHASLPPDASRYESLIPSALPGVDEQYAFRVDLDACTGCKACVTACHSLNGLEVDENWRRVGLLDSDAIERPAATTQSTVTTACHHCEDPGCLSGCPVRAYDKDPTTGIVRHLDDQCIGCRYCQLMCPYDVPQYSDRLGIVRKCDMCHGRLAQGEAPACVQGCPNEAISIDVVSTGRASSGAALLPVVDGAMPPSAWTRPTTRYVGGDAGADAILAPVDVDSVEPAEGHTPLAVMLVLTQAAIGTVLVDTLLLPARIAGVFGSQAAAVALSCACLVGGAGLGASVLHLGRPQWAFRAILGLRTSWMSREIVALGGFATMLFAVCAVAWAEVASPAGAAGWVAAVASLRPLAAITAAGAGLLGLLCSVMIYVATRRPLWRLDRTAMRFGATVLWGGLAVFNLGLAFDAEATSAAVRGTQALILLSLVALTQWRLRQEDGRLIASDADGERVALARTRQLLAGPLAAEAGRRRTLLNVAGGALPIAGLLLAAIAPVWSPVVAMGIVGLGLASDLIERSLFFRAEAMPSMPGAG